MRMRLQTEGTKFVVVLAATAKNDQNGNQKVDMKTGAMLWQVTVVPIGDDFMREALNVIVDAEPKVPAGSFVEIVDLVATTWEIDGRSGVSFRAQRVIPSAAMASALSKSAAA